RRSCAAPRWSRPCSAWTRSASRSRPWRGRSRQTDGREAARRVYSRFTAAPIMRRIRNSPEGYDMRRHGRALLCCLLVAAAGSAAAQDSADKRLSLTIYNSNLALVEHLRTLDVAAGRHRVEFKGVSAQIMSQTVSLVAPGLEVIEQNFDYDLLT